MRRAGYPLFKGVKENTNPTHPTKYTISILYHAEGMAIPIPNIEALYVSEAAIAAVRAAGAALHVRISSRCCTYTICDGCV